MIGRNHVIEMELIEQLALIALQPPHHRKPPPLNGAGTESLFAANSNRLLQQNRPKIAVDLRIDGLQCSKHQRRYLSGSRP